MSIIWLNLWIYQSSTLKDNYTEQQLFGDCLQILLGPVHDKRTNYTWSHPENDRDVTERAQGYTLQDASFMRQSRCSFLNAWENTQVACAMTSVFVWNTRWRHGHSRGETKYSCHALATPIYRNSTGRAWLCSQAEVPYPIDLNPCHTSCYTLAMPILWYKYTRLCHAHFMVQV